MLGQRCHAIWVASLLDDMTSSMQLMQTLFSWIFYFSRTGKQYKYSAVLSLLLVWTVVWRQYDAITSIAFYFYFFIKNSMVHTLFDLIQKYCVEFPFDVIKKKKKKNKTKNDGATFFPFQLRKRLRTESQNSVNLYLVSGVGQIIFLAI